MPKKPTSPFGTLNFSKNGLVQPNISQLSKNKDLQEAGAMEIYKDTLEGSGVSLVNLQRLPEDDHDFAAELNGEHITIQLTELVSREFWDPETYALDPTKEALALWDVISNKLRKHYQKPSASKFWLLIFSTYPYSTEYFSAGEKHFSPGLVYARSKLARCIDNPFDEIWFSSLTTNAVQVFPGDH